MNNIIKKTYELIDTLEQSSLIKNLTKYKNNLLKNKKALSQIEIIKKETNQEKLISLRKELYKNNYYKMYMKYYQELSFLVLKINKKYSVYTNTKEHNHGI